MMKKKTVPKQRSFPPLCLLTCLYFVSCLIVILSCALFYIKFLLHVCSRDSRLELRSFHLIQHVYVSCTRASVLVHLFNFQSRGLFAIANFVYILFPLSEQKETQIIIRSHQKQKKANRLKTSHLLKKTSK